MPRGLRQLGISLASLARTAYDAGLVHLVASVFFLQGMTYLAQVAAARLLTPSDFGIIRTTESVIAILLILGSCGMPSLAVKCVAECKDAKIRARLTGKLLQTCLYFAVGVAVLSGIFFTWVTPARYPTQLRSLVWVIIFTSLSRVCYNYYQGIKEVRGISLVVIGLSAISLSIILGAVWSFGIRGWVLGRYAAEALFLTVGFLSLGSRVAFRGPLPEVYGMPKLVSTGSVLSGSLLIRTALDNLPLLSLSALSRSPEETGYYGLGSIVVLGALILPGGVSNLALPRFAERRESKNANVELFLRVSALSLAGMAAVALCGILITPLFVTRLFARYRAAIPIIQILMLSLPLRALTTLSGTLFLAYDRNAITLLMNAALFVVALKSYAFAIPTQGVEGLAWASVLLELLSSILYVGGALGLLLAHRGVLDKKSISGQFIT